MLLIALLNAIAIEQFSVMLAVSSSKAFVVYQVLYTHDPIEDCLGPGRATGHVHIYRNNLIYALQYTVGIEYTA